jgi:hypothetical protein
MEDPVESTTASVTVTRRAPSRKQLWSRQNPKAATAIAIPIGTLAGQPLLIC